MLIDPLKGGQGSALESKLGVVVVLDDVRVVPLSPIQEFDAAARVLERSLAPARKDTDLSKLVPDETGLAGWVVWPMTDYVARHGVEGADSVGAGGE